MIHSNELIPFVDSLRVTSDAYTYGEPRENYDFHGKMLSVGEFALRSHPAKTEVDFNTWYGEYLNLFLDNPPMTDWIEEWQQLKIPGVLIKLGRMLQKDESPIPDAMYEDLQISVELLERAHDVAAGDQRRLAELWRTYDLLRDFYEKHSTEFDNATQQRLQKLAQLRDAAQS